MALLATLDDHRRSAQRQVLSADATLRLDGRPLDALIVNLSVSGCLFICSAAIEVGDVVTLGLAGIGRHEARIVRAEGTRFGAEFVASLAPAQVDAAAARLSETVVSFPLPLTAALGEREAEAAPAAPTLSAATRLTIIAGLAAAAWLPVVTALHALG